VFLAAWAFEIINGREKLMAVQKIKEGEYDTQKRTRTRSEETKSSKRQRKSDECFFNESHSEEKDCIHSKIKSLAIENLPKHIVPIPSIRNRSGYKGLKEMTGGKWMVEIDVGGRRVRVGDKFDSALDAGCMYAWAFEEIHGSDNLQKSSRNSESTERNCGKEIEKMICVPDDEIMALLSSLDIKHLPSDIMPFPSKINAGGCVGVQRFKNKWAAYIKFKGRRIRLGLFDSASDAGKMYAWGFKIINGEDSLRHFYDKQDVSFPQHPTGFSEPLTCVGDEGSQVVGCSENSLLINQVDSNHENAVVPGEGSDLHVESNEASDSLDFGRRRAEEILLKDSDSMSVSRAANTGVFQYYSSHQTNNTSAEDFSVQDQQNREMTISVCIRDALNWTIEDKYFKAKRSTKVKKLMRTWFKCNSIDPCGSVGLFFQDRFLSYEESLATFGIRDGAILIVKERNVKKECVLDTVLQG